MSAVLPVRGLLFTMMLQIDFLREGKQTEAVVYSLIWVRLGGQQDVTQKSKQVHDSSLASKQKD